MDGRAGLTLEFVWMLGRQEETFLSQKLIYDSLVIQPTTLPSCQAGSCPKSTETSNITQRMNTGFSSTLSHINPRSKVTPSAR
jgi:hypothetical protein